MRDSSEPLPSAAKMEQENAGARSARPTGDLRRFLAVLKTLDRCPHGVLRGWFAPSEPILIARAPGRLDVMGGIADYCGSLVLQLPLREATFAAVGRAEDGAVKLASLAPDKNEAPRTVTLSPREFQKLLGGGYDEAREFFRRDAATAWAAYVAGALLVLARERGVKPDGGLRILIHSDVPEGKGVSSSAALEVATLEAVSHLLGAPLEGGELARLCQWVENRVVGAPCGIMDQMTAALGRADHLLALCCQPAEVQGFVPLPASINVWGIDSAVRHAVSGSDYTSVRVGAFMGYRIIADLAGLKVTARNPDGTVTIDDPRWGGYLANVGPREFDDRFADHLPKQLRGDAFLERYGGTTDPVTRVDPLRTYAVRQPTTHPVYEHHRVKRFAELLSGDLDEQGRIEMGELMYGSHESYSACKLGSDGTDLLVRLVRQAGSEAGLYGAKITGGGSGGTVAVLGRADATGAVNEIARQYEEMAGRRPIVFCGSSDGACRFGVVTLDGTAHPL